MDQTEDKPAPEYQGRDPGSPLALKVDKDRLQRLKRRLTSSPLPRIFSKSPADWVRGWATSAPFLRRLNKGQVEQVKTWVADTPVGRTLNRDQIDRVKERVADTPMGRYLSKDRIDRFKTRVANSPVGRNRVAILVWRVIREMSHDDATHLAAGVAYYAIFSLFPLMLGLLAIAGMVLGSAGIQRQFLDFATGFLPGSGELVENNVEAVVRFRGALGVVAVIGLLWSASAVFGAISRAVNRAWDVQQDRPFYIAKPRQIAMALAVGVLFLLSTGLTSAIQVLTQRDLGIPGQQLLRDLGVGSLVLRIVPWLITFAIFLMVYRFIPNCKTYWRYVWPGALVAAVLFEVGKSLFVWYLNTFATYDRVYGSLASVMILLFWTYISSLILIIGAEISSEFGRLVNDAPRGTPLEASGMGRGGDGSGGSGPTSSESMGG